MQLARTHVEDILPPSPPSPPLPFLLSLPPLQSSEALAVAGMGCVPGWNKPSPCNSRALTRASCLQLQLVKPYSNSSWGRGQDAEAGPNHGFVSISVARALLGSTGL